MASKRIEELHTQILRDLLKKPANKRCFDCTQPGPVYVVLDHSTFVCNICSGIHREFNHRVKSVSMSTFKPEEIERIQNGGNDVAHRLWMARHTNRDPPEPEAGNLAAIRDFMHQKYVLKRWYSASGVDQSDESLPKVEPLQNLLGANIPPIHTGPTTAPHYATATPNGPAAAFGAAAAGAPSLVPVAGLQSPAAQPPAAAAAPRTAALVDFGAAPVEPKKEDRKAATADILSLFDQTPAHSSAPSGFGIGFGPAQPTGYGAGGAGGLVQQQQQQQQLMAQQQQQQQQMMQQQMIMQQQMLVQQQLMQLQAQFQALAPAQQQQYQAQYMQQQMALMQKSQQLAMMAAQPQMFAPPQLQPPGAAAGAGAGAGGYSAGPAAAGGYSPSHGGFPTSIPAAAPPAAVAPPANDHLFGDLDILGLSKKR